MRRRTSPLNGTTTATKLQIKLNARPDINKSKQALAKMQMDVRQLITVAAAVFAKCGTPEIIEKAKTEPTIHTVAASASALIRGYQNDFNIANQEFQAASNTLDEAEINFNLIGVSERFMAISSSYQTDLMPLIQQFTQLVSKPTVVPTETPVVVPTPTENPA
jgi:hypothetical protein